MSALAAFNRTRGSVLCERLEVANGTAGQVRGLLGRDRLEPGSGLLFKAARLFPVMWMHSFGMRFPICVVFLDKDTKVIKIDRRLDPWRTSSIVVGARYALELSIDTDLADTQVGDHVDLVHGLDLA